MQNVVRAIQELSKARTLGEIATIVRTTARHLSGADGATFVLRDGEFCYYMDEDAIAPLWKGKRFPSQSCISGWCMHHGQIVVIEDIFADDRIPHDLYRATFVKSLVMVPIRSGDPIGAIGTYWAQPYRATAEQIELLRALADSTATAIENIQLHAQLEQHNRNLERTVQERTQELNDARLHAEQANATKSRFLGAASHNLRQPLQTLGAVNAILARTCTDAAAREHVRCMAEAIKHMESMLNTLLDLNRLEAGAVEPRFEDVSLESMCARLRSDFSYLASAKGLALDVQQTELAVHSDPNLLQEILLNFLSNAIKYTAQGRVTLRCRAIASGEIVITVQDTGPGIPQAHRDRLFEAFYRAPGAYESQAPGLGLGLSIVDQLARVLGHPVQVDSTEGEGTTFSITVPGAQGKVHHTPHHPVMADDLGARAPASGSILYVEDDPSVRKSLSMLLEIEGYDVHAVSTGAEAIQAITAATLNPAIIISDFQLPAGETGESVIGRVRELLGRHVPALLLTGRTGDHDLASDVACKVLRKPVDPDQLLEQIATFTQPIASTAQGATATV